MNNFSITKYFEESSKLISSLKDHEELILNFADKLSNIIISGNKIMFCGNGGSAAQGEHLAAELIVRLRSDFPRNALPGISLTLDSATLTATGNDISFSEIYARSIEAFGKEGDALFALSTSGNSLNIVIIWTN